MARRAGHLLSRLLERSELWFEIAKQQVEDKFIPEEEIEKAGLPTGFNVTITTSLQHLQELYQGLKDLEFVLHWLRRQSMMVKYPIDPEKWPTRKELDAWTTQIIREALKEREYAEEAQKAAARDRRVVEGTPRRGVRRRPRRE